MPKPALQNAKFTLNKPKTAPEPAKSGIYRSPTFPGRLFSQALFSNSAFRVPSSYGGVGGDQLTFNADRSTRPEVNGNPVDLAPTKVFDSLFIQSKYNCGVVEIRKDSRHLLLNFNDRSSSK